MSKRFLGIICLLYSGIFGYVIFFDKLKFFLAPNMQIYLKLSVIPMLIIGIVMLFDKKIEYKFKISDLILLLPLIILLFTGDGRLSANFASNRINKSTNKVITDKVKKKDTKEEKTTKKETKEEKTTPKEKDSSYDFNKPFFDIDDQLYNELSNYLTFTPKAEKFKGKTIKVRGFALKKATYIPDGYFALGKYSISCCAADAGFTGFIAKTDKFTITENKWYEIEGVLDKAEANSNDVVMYINVINMKEISPKNEEQYVYPCYSNDNDSCEELEKYKLEY